MRHHQGSDQQFSQRESSSLLLQGLSEHETLDARGGSDIVQVLPKNVTFLQGVNSLACMRLTDKGMVRWYASCCKTPIGNTLADYKISFIGLLHDCLESEDRLEGANQRRLQANAIFPVGNGTAHRR